MKIMNDQDTLMFDDQDSRCFFHAQSCQGQTFAFIVCLDIGPKNMRFVQPYQKYYWGKLDWDNKEKSIQNILHTGAKWDFLAGLEL